MKPLFEFGSHIFDPDDFDLGPRLDLGPDSNVDPDATTDPEVTTDRASQVKKSRPVSRDDRIDFFIDRMGIKLKLMDRRLDELEMALRKMRS